MQGLLTLQAQPAYHDSSPAAATAKLLALTLKGELQHPREAADAALELVSLEGNADVVAALTSGMSHPRWVLRFCQLKLVRSLAWCHDKNVFEGSSTAQTKQKQKSIHHEAETGRSMQAVLGLLSCHARVQLYRCGVKNCTCQGFAFGMDRLTPCPSFCSTLPF